MARALSRNYVLRKYVRRMKHAPHRNCRAAAQVLPIPEMRIACRPGTRWHAPDNAAQFLETADIDEFSRGSHT